MTSGNAVGGRNGSIPIPKFIFDTIDTGLCNDGINTHEQYQCVSMHARSALHMRKSTFPHAQVRTMLASGGDSGETYWIFLSDCLHS